MLVLYIFLACTVLTNTYFGSPCPIALSPSPHTMHDIKLRKGEKEQNGIVGVSERKEETTR